MLMYGMLRLERPKPPGDLESRFALRGRIWRRDPLRDLGLGKLLGLRFGQFEGHFEGESLRPCPLHSCTAVETQVER